MCVGSTSKFETSLFFLYFLNKDISLNISCKVLKFGIHNHGCHSEGHVSQILYLGPSFYFMQSTKKKIKK